MLLIFPLQVLDVPNAQKLVSTVDDTTDKLSSVSPIPVNKFLTGVNSKILKLKIRKPAKSLSPVTTKRARIQKSGQYICKKKKESAIQKLTKEGNLGSIPQYCTVHPHRLSLNKQSGCNFSSQ